jgi:hypothetical protein
MNVEKDRNDIRIAASVLPVMMERIADQSMVPVHSHSPTNDDSEVNLMGVIPLFADCVV